MDCQIASSHVDIPTSGDLSSVAKNAAQINETEGETEASLIAEAPDSIEGLSDEFLELNENLKHDEEEEDDDKIRRTSAGTSDSDDSNDDATEGEGVYEVYSSAANTAIAIAGVEAEVKTTVAAAASAADIVAGAGGGGDDYDIFTGGDDDDATWSVWG